MGIEEEFGLVSSQPQPKPKFWQKKLSLFGKQISVLAIVGLIFSATLVSAALLTYFGQITTTIDVEQAIILTGVGCSNNMCDDDLDAVGSETVFGNTFDIESNTENDIDVTISNNCLPDCDGVTITNQVDVSVDGFTDPNTAFDLPYYKKSYYNTPVVHLSNLNTVTYSFKITESSFGDTVAPYVVLVSTEEGGDGFPYGAAVYLIPDGETYAVGTDYEKTLDEDSKFHVPGDTHGCADQSTGCTLAEIKGHYPNADLSKISVAVGAFPGDGLSMDVFMGIGTINGEQAEHLSVRIPGDTTIPTKGKYGFAEHIAPDIYTVTTSIA